GVVCPDVDDRERVTDRLVGVLGRDRAVPLAGLGRRVVQVHDLQAGARDHAAGLGHRAVDAVLHACAFRQHRALHRPRGVETKLALRALLGVADGGSTDKTEEQCDGRGHAQDSHGWTSLIGAIMRHSDPAGRYQTMPDRPLSTLARATAHTESSRGRGAVLEWTSKVTEARPTHAPPSDLRREARLAARGRPRAVRPTGARDRAPEPGRPLRRTEANGP